MFIFHRKTGIIASDEIGTQLAVKCTTETEFNDWEEGKEALAQSVGCIFKGEVYVRFLNSAGTSEVLRLEQANGRFED